MTMAIIRVPAAASMNTFQNSTRSHFSSASIILAAWQSNHRPRQLSNPSDPVGILQPCMANLPTFCFVIPCFNEEDNVGLTVDSVRGASGGRGGYENVLVNEASTHCTFERMQAVAGTGPRIRVLDNPTNLGFGGSYKRGASVATATYVMMLPGDNGFPGQSIAEILGHAGEADIIIPIVTNRGARHWLRAFASEGFTTLLNWTFWLNVGYYNGAVLQRNELLRSIEITTNSFAYQAEALVKLIA